MIRTLAVTNKEAQDFVEKFKPKYVLYRSENNLVQEAYTCDSPKEVAVLKKKIHYKFGMLRVMKRKEGAKSGKKV